MNSAKEEPKPNSSKSRPSDPGIFQGLPNGSTYCYLNTALQELYHDLPRFREKVLSVQVPDIINSQTDAYKELLATQFFFKYLQNPNSVPTFNRERNSYAELLGYKNGEYGSSSEAKSNIELKCRDQMRKLKGKSSLISQNEAPKTKFRPHETYIEKKWKKILDEYKAGEKPLTDREKEDIINTSGFISMLWRDGEFKNKVYEVVNNNQLTLKNAYITLETIKELFERKDQGKSQYYSKEGCELIYKIRGFKTCNMLKNKVLNEISAFNRSKRAQVLSIDSNILIDGFNIEKNVIDSLKHYCNDKRKDDMQYYLPLKNNKFSITFSDSAHTGRTPRKNFEVGPELDLTDLVKKDNILKIFVKGEELKRDSYKFDLISASIGTGNHYYLYKRVDDKRWHQINDNEVTTHLWDQSVRLFGDSVQQDIQQHCETLTYELKT